MGVPRLAVSANPLDLEALVGVVSGGPGGHGAVVTFLGVVRDENAGRRVTRLEYEAYEELAVKVFERIGAETAERWPQASVALHHRTGGCRSEKQAWRLPSPRRIEPRPSPPVGT